MTREKALKLLKILRDDYIHGELDKDINEAINELEEFMKPKMCEGCKWEQETKLITTKVGDKVDICKQCTRYENLQDHYEPKATT